MSEGSSSSSSEEEEIEYLAKTREKRNNAGSKMAKLLNDEEEDEFYQTTYGGFNEEGEDIDYDSNKSDSDDLIDSDFDIDENDEVKSDMEDDEPKKKKTTGVYQEPKEKKPAMPKEKKSEVKKEKKEPKPKTPRSSIQIYQTSPLMERKSRRACTAVKSQATAKREKQREEKSKMMKEMAARKNVPEVRRLTQEELLSEAKRTEKENLKSLENYYKLELEKKKSKIQKQVFKGPIIRYQSVTMPNLEDFEPDIIVDGEGSNEAVKKLEDMETDDKCSRTFITFTEDHVYHDYFPQKKQKPVQKQICPVTKLPAKYFDPITQTPYATLYAFKCIREAYAQQCEVAHKRTKSAPEPKTNVTVAANG